MAVIIYRVMFFFSKNFEASTSLLTLKEFSKISDVREYYCQKHLQICLNYKNFQKVPDASKYY